VIEVIGEGKMVVGMGDMYEVEIVEVGVELMGMELSGLELKIDIGRELAELELLKIGEIGMELAGLLTIDEIGMELAGLLTIDEIGMDDVVIGDT
jgi:hypothetical protein